MNTLSIEVVGTARGAFWWPTGEPFEQTVRQSYALTDDEPFCNKWNGIDSALDDLRDKVAGDSSEYPVILDAQLLITRQHGNERTVRFYDITPQ